MGSAQGWVYRIFTVDRHVATRGPGLTGVFKAGYDFGSLRAEFKYRVRTHGNNTSLVGSSTNLAKISKGREMEPSVSAG